MVRCGVVLAMAGTVSVGRSYADNTLWTDQLDKLIFDGPC